MPHPESVWPSRSSGIQVFAGRRKFSHRPNSEKCDALHEIILDVTKTGVSPPILAEAVLDVLLAEEPPARRLVGKDALFLKFIARAIPDFARDAIFRRLFLGNPSFGSDPT